jgi:hypothetical protein
MTRKVTTINGSFVFFYYILRLCVTYRTCCRVVLDLVLDYFWIRLLGGGDDELCACIVEDSSFLVSLSLTTHSCSGSVGWQGRRFKYKHRKTMYA